MSDFNSIKVRLKHTSLCDKSKAFLSFQFHKGTIKTNLPMYQIACNPEFQFHKGTIKTKS